MNKRFKFYGIAWLAFFAAFNVICFTVPAENAYAKPFWLGYVSITLAFIGQLACAYAALKPASRTKLFYNIPIIRVSVMGLILTLVAGILCMTVPKLPVWVGIALCAVIFAFTAVAVVKAEAVSEVAENIDGKAGSNTDFIRRATAEAESLAANAATPAAKAACRKVYEALRYSDPVSGRDTQALEGRIWEKLHAFSETVRGDAANGLDGTLSDMASEIEGLASERNKQCRAGK